MGTMKMGFYLDPTTAELQIQKTQKMLQMQLEIVWKCHSHGPASIIKAKNPEVTHSYLKNAVKSTR